MNKLKPAVFLDRDGTLIKEVGYISNINDLELIECASKAVRKLNEHNIPAIVITNQSGIARGYFKEETVKVINQGLSELLKRDNVYLDGIYYCPHHPEGTVTEYSIHCNCRKPESGMIKKALNDFKEVDLKLSYVIGDKPSDIKLAENIGSKAILVKTGYGLKTLESSRLSFTEPAYIADNITDAVEWLLQDLNLK